MSLLLYAISERRADPVDDNGIGGHPLKAVGSDGLTAIVSGHDAAPVDPSDERLWEYEQVIERLMSAGPILPARFGSVLDDEAAAKQLLRARHEQLTLGLDRVRGAVELGVRARWRDAEEIPACDGTAYMRHRLELRRRAREIGVALDPLRALARSTSHRVLPAPTAAVIAAYLVDRDRVEQFAREVARIDQSLADVALVCTGPWPPYSFAQGDTL